MATPKVKIGEYVVPVCPGCGTIDLEIDESDIVNDQAHVICHKCSFNASLTHWCRRIND